MIEERARSYINISNYDLDTAKDLLQAGRYIYVAFFCRQAIEKLLKGLYTDFKNEKPNVGHDLLKVFHLLDIKETDLADKEKFMIELNNYYLEDLSSEEIDKITLEFSRKDAESLLEKTKDLLIWLKAYTYW